MIVMYSLEVVRLTTHRARSFMRSIVREDAQVGLLLFDEPSASLDPVAEHGERTFLDMHSHYEVYAFEIQICSTVCGSYGATRRWYSLRTGLES